MLFYIKKIITPFLMPPGIIILLLFVLGMWFLRKKRLKLALLQIAVGLLMWFAALGPVAKYLFETLEAGYPIPQNPRGDVIILLGGGINDTAVDLSGIGIPTHALLERIVAAVRIYKRIQVPIIASGGSAFDQKIPESDVIKRYLMELDVPENMIIVDEKSRDTFENAINTKEICEKAGYTSPILVTSAFHIKRAVLGFKKIGMQVVAFPTGSHLGEDKSFHFRDLLPNDYHGISLALKEFLGIIYYIVVY